MFKCSKILFVLILPVFLLGCVTVKNMVANSFPTYDETVQNWPELDTNHSRLFLFLPDEKFLRPTSYCKVTVDGVDYGGILNGTFMFIDVTKGEHTLFCTNSNTPKLILNTKGGDIVYISGTSPLKVVDIQDIQDQLKVLNHTFDEALPYDDQPFTIKRRSKK
ncbi:MAG: DUF2846 domain-containing protein [Gammaproteobacteria bacterium]|nr:DUF2846 domain-containing protein [Gammaproteobacteria bacterium]